MSKLVPKGVNIWYYEAKESTLFDRRVV